jgi:signal transduction histidine kinase
MRRPIARLGLSTRIFVTIALVILAGAGTLLLVALWVAPQVFAGHLARAGLPLNAAEQAHVEEGFADAVLTSILAGVSAAVLVAVIAAALVARRLTGPLALAAQTATRLADGDLSARMPQPGMGPELAELARSVNTLAARLEQAELRRERLLTDVAHELRTPLTAIEATVEALADGVLPADAPTLGSLTAQTRRLTRLTQDLAATSRSEEHAFTVHRRQVDLGPLVHQVVAGNAARYAAAHVRLTARADDPCPAHVDPDRVVEVLDQLLDNALRHCSPGCSVQVHATRTGSAAQVDVTDDGAGFDADRAEELFVRFTRGAVPSPTGSGVGLTIARALVVAQGGTLTASSDGPGRGARFTVRVPGL